jgi:shikimate dehydrogenase
VKRLGIIGYPLGHSLSPAFQGAALRECGLDARYDLWETPPDLLEVRVLALREPDCLGANVTIPYKESVFPLLDELGGQSARIGAVNTIVNRSGRLFGFNTDGTGFVAALREEARFEPAGRSFLLLGAGGAARGIAFALAEARAGRVAIWNRTPERAARLAADVAAAGGEAAATAAADPGGFDCVVNCTSVGMAGTGTEGQTPAHLARLRPGVLAVDIVYRPARTTFLEQAGAAGAGTLGGLPMLIYQGALAFELWTGVRAPVDVMFEAARRALDADPRRRGAAAGEHSQS